MNVDQIYSRNVIRVARSSTAGEAARIMKSSNVGFLIVTDDAPNEFQAIGVITDRDLAINGFAEDLNPRWVTVGELMSAQLQTIEASADLQEALANMKASACRRLAVTNSAGQIVGVLSMDDVVDGIAADLSAVASTLRKIPTTDRHPGQLQVPGDSPPNSGNQVS